MTERYDIVILGGGNAGFGVAGIGQAAGKRIAFVEPDLFGGTCPNRGCTPKKVLVAAAHAMDEIARAGAHGIDVGSATLDWATLIDREQAMIDFVPSAMADAARAKGDVYTDAGRFIGPNAVQAGEHILEADNIVIATGSTPRPLDIDGAGLLATSDDLLRDRTLPDDVVFIGGGVIAMEFSHVLARAGANVTVLEVMPGLLPALDPDAVDQLRQASEHLGINVRTSVEVLGVAPDDDAFLVHYRVDGQTVTQRADRVVNGAGRVANIAELDLSSGGVSHSRSGVSVDAHLRSTSNPAVWVCGDALAGTPQLSPTATDEGRVVGNNIVDGPRHTLDYRTIPTVVHTVPALASVGLNEAAARDQYPSVTVKTTDLSEWFSARTYAEPTAWAKVLVDGDSDRFVGAHLVGHRGEELIHTFSLAMQHGISATALRESHFAFPTFSSDIRNLF